MINKVGTINFLGLLFFIITQSRKLEHSEARAPVHGARRHLQESPRARVRLAAGDTIASDKAGTAYGTNRRFRQTSSATPFYSPLPPAQSWTLPINV